MPLNTVRNWSVGKKLSLVLISIVVLPSLISGVFMTFFTSSPTDENVVLIKQRSEEIADLASEAGAISYYVVLSEVREAIKEFPTEFLNQFFYAKSIANLLIYTGVGLLLALLVFKDGIKGILFKNKTPILFFASIMLALNIPEVASDAMELNELLGLNKLQEMLFDSNDKIDLAMSVEQFIFLFPNDDRWYFITWIGIALIPAVGEEIFFRGLLMRLFTEKLGNIHNAIAITAAIFALCHFSLTNFFYYFILAVVLGYTYYWGRSLLFPILIHLINNTNVLWGYFRVGAYPQLKNELPIDDINGESVTLMSYITIAIILAVFYFNYKRYLDEQFLIK